MTIVLEPFAGLAGADPAILQPREAALVQRHRSVRAVARPQYAIVAAHQPAEPDDGYGQPPEAEDWIPGEHGDQDREPDRRQAAVRVAGVGRVQLVTRRPPGGQAGPIFVKRGVWHLVFWIVSAPYPSRIGSRNGIPYNCSRLTWL